MNELEKFNKEKEKNILLQGSNDSLKSTAGAFMTASIQSRYSYNFSWLGRPIIQYPQDMIAMQEIIWDLKPDLIIETGIAHGGSLIYYASVMELIGKGEIIGIDIDIRDHNRKEIEAHPMYKRITMVEGSAIDGSVIEQVKNKAKGKKTIMVCLDSNHTHDHVLAELRLYHPFVSKGSWLVVFDTIVEYMPRGMYDRPWDQGNNPNTAITEFLKENKDFEIDYSIDNKLLISVAPGGYLKRTQK